MSWLWGTSQVDETIDKATSELLPSGSEDIALNLEISDQIRSKSVQPKDAMRAMKRRLNHKNPNVQLLALGLTDTCVKNGGDHFLTEIASREFMDNLVSILKMPMLNLDVKNKILRLIQSWATAFEGKPSLSYVGQVYKTLKSEGFSFPPQDFVAANSAMVDTQTAPEWIDSDVCMRCRTQFTFTNRKHHCRNCGRVFDQACSSKTLPLPHFGIAQEVRVCDECHSKLTKKRELEAQIPPSRHSSSSHSRHRSHRAGREAYDTELQRAIQLSLQEVGAGPSNHGYRPGYVPAQPSGPIEPPIVPYTSRPRQAAAVDDDDDPDLKAAIAASIAEANAPKASAPPPAETPSAEQPGFSYMSGQSTQNPSLPYVPALPSVPTLPNYDLAPLETDAIMTFNQTVEAVEAQGGRDISRFPAVNELYDKANGLRPKLAMSLDDTDRKEKLLSEMHDKLSQAVRLYDSLLTEQLSRPAWRSNTASSSVQPVSQPSGYGASRYNTVDGAYGQQRWEGAQSPQISNQYAPSSQPQFVQNAQQQFVASPATETPYQPMHFKGDVNANASASQQWQPPQAIQHVPPGPQIPPMQQQFTQSAPMQMQYPQSPPQVVSPPPMGNANGLQMAPGAPSMIQPPAIPEQQPQPQFIQPPPNIPNTHSALGNPPHGLFQPGQAQPADVLSPSASNLPQQLDLSRQNALPLTSRPTFPNSLPNGNNTPAAPAAAVPAAPAPAIANQWQAQPIMNAPPQQPPQGQKQQFELPHFPSAPTSSLPQQSSYSMMGNGVEQTAKEALLIEL